MIAGENSEAQAVLSTLIRAKKRHFVVPAKGASPVDTDGSQLEATDMDPGFPHLEVRLIRHQFGTAAHFETADPRRRQGLVHHSEERLPAGVGGTFMKEESAACLVLRACEPTPPWQYFRSVCFLVIPDCTLDWTNDAQIGRHEEKTQVDVVDQHQWLGTVSTVFYGVSHDDFG